MDPDFFTDNYRPNSELWRDQAVAIGRNAGLPAKSFRAFTAGVNLVAMIDEAWVIKIFPPFQVHQWESESRVLRALPDGLASVQIPELRIAGELPWGWRFVVMSLVPGDTLDRQ